MGSDGRSSALSPGDFRVRWHTAQVSAEVPRIQGQLTIFTAASLTEAFKEMGANIEQANPAPRSSSTLPARRRLTQLAQGARADVFASADEPNMQGAQKEGTIASEPRLFVRNQLVAIVPAANPAQVMRLQDLAKPGVKLVLTNKEVPVGNYSRQALAKMSQDAAFGSEFTTRVLANLVSEETNVKQVVAKVQLGEADAGIVYSSDVTPAVRGAVQVLAIPEPFNVIAQYPIAVVRDAPNAAGARAFIDYVLSPAGQAILTKHGFLAVAPTAGELTCVRWLRHHHAAERRMQQVAHQAIPQVRSRPVKGAEGAIRRSGMLSRPVCSWGSSCSLAALVWRAVIDPTLWASLTKPIVLDALWVTGLTASATLLLALLVGTPLAYVLARRQFPGKWLVETVTDLPLVLPPVTAGVALLMAFGRRTPGSTAVCARH